MNTALALIQDHESLSAAAAVLVKKYRLSKRQAYRYLEEAQVQEGPVPLPDRKVTFTVKLSHGVVEALRKHARMKGRSLSELVTQALEAWLAKGRGRG